MDIIPCACDRQSASNHALNQLASTSVASQSKLYTLSFSDTILNVLFHQVAENVDFQVRFHWEPNSISTVSTQRRA
ncbi:hypothetical protein P692DRAFT_201797270 [Suillus brevipes Sb2]|nr:hypothetical protein P692DRAFT_201797270 [Suillus brevipes Sb2]